MKFAGSHEETPTQSQYDCSLALQENAPGTKQSRACKSNLVSLNSFQHPLQSGMKLPTKMPFTGWAISKAPPEDQEFRASDVLFIRAKGRWTVNPSYALQCRQNSSTLHGGILTGSSNNLPSEMYPCDFFFFFWPHLAACRIFVPWPGIKPVPPAMEAQSSHHRTAREFSHVAC